MTKIVDLDKHRNTYPLPCVSGQPLRWHVALSSRFCLDEIADDAFEDWDHLKTYPVIEYVANSENGAQYVITFDSKSGAFDIMHTSASGSGVLIDGVSALGVSKILAERHRSSVA